MAYTATINGELFFDTNAISKALGLTSASLTLKAGAAGTFAFTVPPSNKFYNQFHLTSDYIDVYRDDDLIFSGRVSYVSEDFDLPMDIEAEGLLSVLNDTIFRPIVHEGTLYQLLQILIANHNGQVEEAKQIQIGNIEIADRACYRPYENYETTYSRIDDLVTSFGGYLSIRKENGILYLDWKEITLLSEQTIDFGENLLSITQEADTEDYITVLIPLGAEYEDEETGERKRLTIESVNSGKDYIELAGTKNKIVGVEIWEDITVAANLLSAGEKFLEEQSVIKTTIDVTAVDLADAGYDVERFEVGKLIKVTSRPHTIDEQTFECQKQTLNLLSPADNNLELGATVDGFTIKARKEALLNTRLIEQINANYATNKRLNQINSDLKETIQENYTLIEQNSESIDLLAKQVEAAARVFYEQPTVPYHQGDLWYRGIEDDAYSGVPLYAIPGYAIPGAGGDFYICTADRTSGTFSIDDWEPTFYDQLGSINKKVSNAEVEINGAKSDILLHAESIDYLNGQMSSARIDIDGLNSSISLKVDKSNYTAAQIALMINNAGSTVAISATHIKLEGIVTANNYFKIKTDGSMEATNGSFNGVVTATSGTIGLWTLSSTGTLSWGNTSKPGNNGFYLSNEVIRFATVDSSDANAHYFQADGSTLSLRHYVKNSSWPANWNQSSTEYYRRLTIQLLGYNNTTNGRWSVLYFNFSSQNDLYISTHGWGTVGNYSTAVHAIRLTCGATSLGATTASSLTVSGTKSRVVDTENYGRRLLYCYETPSPMFGDIGTSILDDQGLCYVDIHDIFAESIADIECQVFLQKEGQGDLWIEEKSKYYFVVKGTPGLKFSWELKAVQRDYDGERLMPYDPFPLEVDLPDGQYGEEDTELQEPDYDNYEESDNIDVFEALYSDVLYESIREQEELIYDEAA